MIWECQITSVICTANEIEAGRVRSALLAPLSTAHRTCLHQMKFRRYWPEDEKVMQFGPYRVSKVIVWDRSTRSLALLLCQDEANEKAFSCEHYKISPLIITQGENRRHVLLYHFLHWLDHDVPNDEAPILELLLRMHDDRSLSPDTPILVHCRLSKPYSCPSLELLGYLSVLVAVERAASSPSISAAR